MGFEIVNSILKQYIEEGEKEIVIPDGVTEIGEQAFIKCDKITKVIIPEGVINIGRCAFDNCKNLREIRLPDSLKNIGGWAFSDCHNLFCITIPDKVKYVGYCAFKYCTALSDENGFVILNDTLYYYGGKDEIVTIPDGVTSIGNGAFSLNSNIKTIIIPESVTSIGDNAFEFCTELTSMIIPESVTNIGNRIFYCSGKLTKLTVMGYTVNIIQKVTTNIELSKIVSMIKNKDYSIKTDSQIKYQFAAQIFLKEGESEAKNYIKKNISNILMFFIDINDYDTVRGLLESGEFVTKRNIGKFVNYSINNTQKGGDLQIQAFIMDYKNRKFPYDSIDNLKI